MVEAMREAKVATGWIDPDEDHEVVVGDFIDGLYASAAFVADLEGFVARAAPPGEAAALGRTLLTLTSPGVPDVYQGDELWDLAPVDPDNRRRVDWGRRRSLVDEVASDAAARRETAKMHLIDRALALRERRPAAVERSYRPLDGGERATAYARGDEVIAAMPIRVAGPPGPVRVPEDLRGRWTSVPTGAELELGAGTARVEMTGPLAEALLERTRAAWRRRRPEVGCRAVPVARRLVLPSAALAVLACPAAAAAAAGANAVAVSPAEPPAAAPAHRALVTGWGRARGDGGEPLHAEPRLDAAVVAAAPPGIAGRTQRGEPDRDGAVWLRMAFPGGVHGWAPGTAIAAAPPTPVLAPRTRRALVRATASLGRGSALVVRDPLGRTIFAAGARQALSIASVTKLATVGAALGGALTVRESAAILGPSDNDRAQALSNRVGGGSRAAGARRAVEWAQALGADLLLVDGSGLSPANRARAGEIADLLLAVRADPRFRVLFRGMPVAGRSGTLRWRMRGTAAYGRVRAKTGSLFDHPASSLAGYLWPAGSGLRPDRALVVAMIENGASPYRARPVQDAVAAALAAPGALRAGGG